MLNHPCTCGEPHVVPGSRCRPPRKRPTDKANALFKRAHLPLHISPWFIWVALWRGPVGKRAGFFRNRPGVIKWLPGRLLPRRWGFYILGFEFGSRG